MKTLFLAVFCIGIGAFGAYGFFSKNPQFLNPLATEIVESPAPEETPAEPIAPTEVKHNDLIILTSPLPNDNISSPVTVKGMARGNWFFEGSFPVTLTNWDGLIIAKAPATSTEEWMTTEYIPFEVTLDYPEQPVGSRGSLILQKDNPSGLPENDDALEITIFFK